MIAIIIALIAWPQPQPFGEAFAKLAGQAANAALVPAALLSALITLSSKTLQVDRSVGKPESDEQFESIFTDLVSDSGARRLVIFVDEIDRCSANEVVATLDAIRTFLGADKCVFVVAADQQVLEESLTLAAKQETPANEINPYYSTGSAYLDKVFQYQVSLPPLLSQRITRFAADLVKDREGLWSEINGEYVVSVLVPTHVASPRRVKHLLNAFALSYRLAEDRYRQGLLATEPRVAAAAVAKLVCLRVEFPIVARDLEVDARLPEMVLSVLDQVDAHRSWPAQAMERARAYALSQAAPAALMGDQPSDDEDVQRTTQASNQQLLDYLRRTRTVPGPTRDLVFMHSSGAAFGLDGQLATAIEEAAETADVAAVIERVTGCDDVTLRGVVDLMNHLMRTSVGLGARNVASTLLHLYRAVPTLPVAHVADAASESIALLNDMHREVLNDLTVEAAWNLAAIGASNGAQHLRGAVLHYVESNPDADVAFLLRNPDPALIANRASLARVAASAIVHQEGEDSISQLGHLSDATLLDFLQACRGGIAAELARAFIAFAASERSTVQPQPTTATGLVDASTHDAFDPRPLVSAVAALARDRISSTEIAQQFVLLLLTVDHMSTRGAVVPLLSDLGSVTHDELVEAMFKAAERRPTETWPRWYDTVDPGAVKPHHGALLQKATATLWSRINQDDPPTLKVVERSVTALQRAAQRLPFDARPNIHDSVCATLKTPVMDLSEAQRRTDALGRLQPFADAEFLLLDQVYETVAPTLHGTLSANFGAVVERDGPIASYLFNDVATILSVGGRAFSDPQSELQQLITDVQESAWFDEPFSLELQLKLLLSSGIALTRLPEGLDHNHIVEAVERFTTDAATVAELWLQIATFTVDQLSNFVATLRAKGTVTTDIAEVLRGLRREWTHAQRVEFVRSQIVDPDASRLTTLGASTVGLNELDDDSIAELLVERFTQCHNNPQRRALVDVWTIAHLTSESARRRMINAVVIGLMQPADGSTPSQGQVELGLEALNRLGKPLPYGLKTALGSAVKRAVSGREKLEAKAVVVLEGLGYKTERRGLFARRKTVKYEES